MTLRIAVLIMSVAACRSGKDSMAKDDAMVEMKRRLAAARTQTAHAATPEALPEREAVVALVASHPDERWAALADEDRFLLYEMSPEARGRAASGDVARAYCAGLRAVPFEWWGEPDALTTATSRRLVSLGREAARCLKPLLEANDKLLYLDGETNMLVEQYGWSVADLAAGLAAAILGTPYDPMAPAEQRKARRAELAQAIAR